jgi:16S rRNA (guanine(966)-N(2))-methyltransferase RsmD
MVREALFNILASRVPDRQFFDLFAGTGAVGMEALSRGASQVTFLERNPRTASEIARNLDTLGVAGRWDLQRADVYRWAERWQPPFEPANVFLGPPFPDLQRRADALLAVLAALQRKLAAESVIVLQNEKTLDFALLPDQERWDHRHYGRNWLSIWVKELDDRA